jgi:hypothetical protein
MSEELYGPAALIIVIGAHCVDAVWHPVDQPCGPSPVEGREGGRNGVGCINGDWKSFQRGKS